MPRNTTDVVLTIKVEAEHVLQLEGAAPDLGRGWQAVVEDDLAAVGLILDVALGPGD